MNIGELRDKVDLTSAGLQMHDFIAEQFPICRSLTGNGVRQTLRAIGERIPLVIQEVASGTQVLDWTVPREWNIRDAYIKDASGRRIVDFKRSNLHVMSYSTPVRAAMSLELLKPHLFSLPDHPEWVPYRTSYYQDAWGFCLSHKQLESLEPGEYEVVIDSTLEEGSLSYGEYVINEGADSEVLISCHICHPSLCNDNLSGVALAMLLASQLQHLEMRHAYRFLFVPGTIGAITWLALNEDRLSRIAHGLVLACIGDEGAPSYKRSRRGNAVIDRAVTHVLRHGAPQHDILEFTPYGYDERQYCSPGFDLPVGCLMRTPHGCFPQYHTSADNLTLVTPEALADSFRLCLDIVDVLENDVSYQNTNPRGEPQLGRRGLYPSVGGPDAADEQKAMLWMLNLSDGEHSILDIAERADRPFSALTEAARRLMSHGLLERLDE